MTGQDIRRERLRRHMSQRQLALAIGISQPALKKIESGETVRSRFLLEIERYLGLTSSNFPSATQLSERADEIPVYGTAEGGAGAMTFSSQRIDTAPRPAGLSGVPDAYGLYVSGESMFPRYRPGELLIVHPHIHPRPEDGVVLYDKDKSHVQVKEFVRQTLTEWVLRRYQPKQEDFKLAKKDWPECHVVYGVYSRR